MRADDIELWQFSAAKAAEILAWSERQFSNWTKRYEPFPQKNRGRGYSISYSLSDLLKLDAIGGLVELGLAPEKAFEALAPYGSPYGSLLHNGFLLGKYPGTMTLTLTAAGRFVGLDGPNHTHAIEIRAWPIFDKIFPRIKNAILEDPGRAKLADVKKAIAEYAARIEEVRKRHWEQQDEGTEI